MDSTEILKDVMHVGSDEKDVSKGRLREALKKDDTQIGGNVYYFVLWMSVIAGRRAQWMMLAEKVLIITAVKVRVKEHDRDDCYS